ncbi:MAG: metallophosphoesterase family protein [Ruminococcus sp.]|nr:metallophosphoesterase family protein [Ruminococcus sp.]
MNIYAIIWCAAVVLLIIILVSYHNMQLKTTKKTLVTKKLPESFDGMKIAIISDLHKKSFGKDNYKLIEAVKNCVPDVIFFLGDLISRFETTIKAPTKLITSLAKIAPVYYTYGNHEVDADESVREEIKKLPMTCLLNGSVTIDKDGESINIMGVYFESEYYKNKKGGYRNLPAVSAGDINRRIGEKPDGFTLLLVHNPDYFPAYAEWGADITFSGHIHGGIIRIGKRGLLHPERKFLPKYTAGIYKIGDKALALTTGLGKFRLFNASEVMLVTLKNEFPEK